MADVTNTGGQIGTNASVDTMQSSGDGRTFVSGTVGQRLLNSNFDLEVLRPCAGDNDVTANGLAVNATLLEREWIMFDNVVQDVARERLPVVSDLIARGLVMNLPNAMGVMTLDWQRVTSDLVDAEVTMTGLPRATADQQEFDNVTMPIPIFHKEFYYNLRHLAAARRNGRNPETSHAEVATRKVAELVETVMFNGLTIGGGSIYGLANEPNRLTGAVTASWITATGEQIVRDILNMIDDAQASTNNFFGPYILYVSNSVANRLSEDYKTTSDMTILQRIMEIVGITAVIQTSRLSGTNVLMVQTTNDVVQVINGIQPTMVEWDSHGGFQHNFKIFAIMLPRVRSDGAGQSGIVHYS